MSIFYKDLDEVIKNALGKDIFSTNVNSVKCPKCGLPIRVTSNKYSMTCTNQTPHTYTNNKFLILLLDSYEGYTRAEENNFTFSEQPII